MEDGFPNRKQGSKDRVGCEAPQVDLWFVVSNDVSECLGASFFLFVCFTVKKFRQQSFIFEYFLII